MAVTATRFNPVQSSKLNRTLRRIIKLGPLPCAIYIVTKLTGDITLTHTFVGLDTVFQASYFDAAGVEIPATSVSGNTATWTGTLGAGTNGLLAAVGNDK